MTGRRREGAAHRAAAFFDVDRTLLPGSCLFPLALAMRRRHRLRTITLLRLGLDQARYHRFGWEHESAIIRTRKASLRAIAGQCRDDLTEISRMVVDQVLRPRVYPRALSTIEDHRVAGHLVFLASSSPEDYVAVLGQALGLDGAIGTRAEVEHGVYTGRLDGPIAHGPEKAARVMRLAEELGIHLGSSFAYSDSINDLTLLELVGNPAAVNPDRALARVAREREWPILDFRLPVSQPIEEHRFGPFRPVRAPRTPPGTRAR